MKINLPFLEIMATQACNISCVGCTNYSDLPQKGFLSWSAAKSQIEPWLERVDINDFGIIGGEPLLNPTIKEWIYGIRELMPTAQIRFTTNGLLLHKHIDLVDDLMSIGNCVFKISIHTESERTNSIIDYLFKKYDWVPIREFGIDRFKTGNNVRFQINKPSVFLKSFKNNYENMLPYNSDPKDAFDICVQQTCPLLYEGKIYKCSTSALLKDTLSKFNNPNLDKWKPFLINGLDSYCSQESLQSFVNNFGKANAICTMCPTIKDKDSQIVHFENVSNRKYKILS